MSYVNTIWFLSGIIIGIIIEYVHWMYELYERNYFDSEGKLKELN